MGATLLWFLVAIVFLAIDLLTPHLVLLFFGFGALGASASSALGFTLSSQFVVFITVSLVSLVLLRRKLARIFSGRMSGESRQSEGESSAPSHPLLGQIGKVTQPIALDKPGEVNIQGSFWRAVSEEYLAQGLNVRVVGVANDDSLLLKVASLKAKASSLS